MSGTKRFRVVLLATLVGLWSLATSAQAAITINGFDPDGAGAAGVLNNVAGLAESPGNALAVGFNPASVGSTFTLLYQAKVANVFDANGNPLFTYANNTTGQMTLVIHFQERVDTFSGTAATFSSTGVGVGTFYYNQTFAANDLNGTDFAPNTPGNILVANSFVKVFEGSIGQGSTGSFTVTNATPTALDAFIVNNYDGSGGSLNINSVTGQGSSSVALNSTFVNPAFFTLGPPAGILVDIFSTKNSLPFSQVNPASQVYNGAGATGAAGANNTGFAAVNTIGVFNGGNPAVANVLFEVQSSTTFAAVPEPSTVSLAMTGVGLVSLAGLRSYRRRSTTTTA